MKIPFNIPYTLDESSKNVATLVNNPSEILAKKFTKLCEQFFEEMYPGYKALMTPSCTRALELIALTLNLSEADEVIMPTYNYVGVANAFAQTKCKIVFADTSPISMNITLESIKQNFTSNTKIVLVMHYAGFSDNIEEIKQFCDEKKIILIEDTAQGIGCSYEDRLLGSFGDFSCISFGNQKNISCGEGGVVLYKEKYHSKVIEVFNNGTNKEALEKGEVSHYEWTRLGSKFELSEFSAAILYPLLEKMEEINAARIQVWNELYAELEKNDKLKPFMPKHLKESGHNAHIFFLNINSKEIVDEFIKEFTSFNIDVKTHFSYLHNSAYNLNNCENELFENNSKILRLPMYNMLTNENILHLKNTLKNIK